MGSSWHESLGELGREPHGVQRRRCRNRVNRQRAQPDDGNAVWSVSGLLRRIGIFIRFEGRLWSGAGFAGRLSSFVAAPFCSAPNESQGSS
jgi:hypothetical protein